MSGSFNNRGMGRMMVDLAVILLIGGFVIGTVTGWLR